jgi:drug/metabolite transporter (DMT)-like permease
MLFALWCLLAIQVAWQGTMPDRYLIEVRGITAPQPYPFALVGVEVLLAAAVLAMLGWALSAKSWRRTGRLTICAVVITAVSVFAALNLMHMPQHYISFTLAMLAASVLAIGCWVWCLIRELVRKYR